jgi:hypothetical protein
MDDTVPQENPPADFNKIDLSQLQGFSFGTQWTQDKSGGAAKRDAGERRPARDDRRFPGEDGPGADRRDRRSFRRPNGEGPAGAPAPAGGSRGAPARREYSAERGPGQPAHDRGDRSAAHDRIPYDSPYFAITFYPDDAAFDALVKTIRATCRTIELFEIARTILAKPDRFTLHVARRPLASAAPSAGPAAGRPPSHDRSVPDPPQPRPPLFLSVPDGLPFESEEAAISHVLDKHLGLFFDIAEVEVDPPKGNFQVINRCGVTGELLGPPNYHRYAQIMQQHHAEKLARMPFEAYRSRIETVRDPEVINQWLAKMKKATRYTWKTGGPAKAPPSAVPAPADPTVPEAPADSAKEEEAAGTPAPENAETPPTPETPAAPAAAAPAAESAPKAESIHFDSFEDARAHLLAHAREKLARPASHARFHGREMGLSPAGEIRRAVEGALERQRRFPLDTANGLRGRLRREHFTIFKKGAKGVSYVCAVKRKFRVPGQVFAESIGALISHIEAHPLVKASELVKSFLNIAEVPESGTNLTPEQREKIARLHGDLSWLVHEGYVTEFIDGGLYAPAPIPEARKKEVEREENDPENFPEPVAADQPAPAAPEEAATAEEPAALEETPPPAE